MNKGLDAATFDLSEKHLAYFVSVPLDEPGDPQDREGTYLAEVTKLLPKYPLSQIGTLCPEMAHFVSNWRNMSHTICAIVIPGKNEQYKSGRQRSFPDFSWDEKMEGTD